MGKAGNESLLDRITHISHDDGNGIGGILGSPHTLRPRGHDDVDLQAHEFRGKRRQQFDPSFSGSVLDSDVPALAQTAQGLGVKSVYILNDKQAYGAGVAQYFEDAAKKLGIKVLGNSAYNTKTGTNYQALFQGIAAKHPDAIMVGGLICENGGQLIKDKVAVLGDNQKVKLLLPDGFTTSQTITDAGKASDGLYASVAGVPTDQLTGAGATFVSDFQAKYNPDFIDPYTPYAAAAAQVVLQAIAASDGTRASVAQNLFGAKVTDSVLGTFSINDAGDTDQGSMTIDVVKGGKLTTYKVLTPKADLVETFPDQ